MNKRRLGRKNYCMDARQGHFTEINGITRIMPVKKPVFFLREAVSMFFFPLLLSILILATAGGCINNGKSKAGWKPVKPKNRVFIHEVRWPEETYKILAVWYTGSEKNAEKLIFSNPALDPERLAPGDKLYIPNTLLKRKKKLEKVFVDRFSARPAKKTGKAIRKKKVEKPLKKKTEKPQNSFELFGPR